MNQKNSKGQDEISKLLDSFQVEDTLEEKMDAFKTEKERKTRLQRSRKNSADFQRRYQEEVDLTQVISPVDQEVEREKEPIILDEQDYQDASQTRTMMWDAGTEEEKGQDTNKTVVINDQEIQTLLEEEKGPKLTREVHTTGPRSTKAKDKNTTMIVVAGIIGVLLTCLVVFGIGYFVFDALNGDKVTENQQKDKFKEILDWANEYNSLSDVEKERILTLESEYNKLDDEQKKEIDTVLKAKTGRTFDELLAKTKSDKKEKENHTNNNTQIAQQKAKLKEEINKVTSDLNAAQNELTAAQNEYNTANTELQPILQEVNAAKAEVEALTTKKMDIDQKIPTIEKEYSDLYTQYLNLPYDDPQRPPLWEQVSAKQTELEALKIEKAQIDIDLPIAQQALDAANSKQPDAQARYDTAQSALTSAQNKFNSINTELQRLQSELAKLD